MSAKAQEQLPLCVYCYIVNQGNKLLPEGRWVVHAYVPIKFPTFIVVVVWLSTLQDPASSRRQISEHDVKKSIYYIEVGKLIISNIGDIILWSKDQGWT